MKKIFLLLICFAFCSAALHAAATDGCFARGQAYYNRENYPAAEKEFKECLRLNPNHTDSVISLAGILFMEEKYSESKKYFESALKKLDGKSQYRAYCLSRLGDIAIKENKYADADRYYDATLKINKADVNAIIGKGVIMESRGQIQRAAQNYQLALSVDPYNLVARKKARELELFIMSDDEILDALKERHAAEKSLVTLTPDLKQLFINIHNSELGGDIEFLRDMEPNLPEGYILTLDKDKPTLRVVLSLKGYQRARALRKKDAYDTFVRAGVSTSDVILVRNIKGQNLFTKDGEITPEGAAVIARMKKISKDMDAIKKNNFLPASQKRDLLEEKLKEERNEFLMPADSLPYTERDLAAIQKTSEELGKRGYMSVSLEEWGIIKERSRCLEDVLIGTVGVYRWTVRGNDVRYFVPAPPSESAAREMKYMPFRYVMEARAQQAIKQGQQVPRTSFFGSGNNNSITLCNSAGEVRKYLF